MLLSVTQDVSAEGKSVNVRTNSHTKVSASINGNIQGLETAYQRADGALIISGPVRGKGKIMADHIILEGVVSPGNSPGCMDFNGNVTFSSTATLVMELGGTAPCTEYDQINVANALTINGATLELVLIDGFVPEFRQRFDVLNWGAINGGFATIDTSAAVLPYPLQWDTSQLTVSGEMVVGVPSIADGDLAPFDNPDGVINAADVLIATQLVLDQRVAGALQYAHGDMNSDDVIGVADLILIQNIAMQN